MDPEDMFSMTLVRFRSKTVKIGIFTNGSGNHAAARAMGLVGWGWGAHIWAQRPR